MLPRAAVSTERHEAVCWGWGRCFITTLWIKASQKGFASPSSHSLPREGRKRRHHPPPCAAALALTAPQLPAASQESNQTPARGQEQRGEEPGPCRRRKKHTGREAELWERVLPCAAGPSGRNAAVWPGRKRRWKSWQWHFLEGCRKTSRFPGQPRELAEIRRDLQQPVASQMGGDSGGTVQGAGCETSTAQSRRHRAPPAAARELGGVQRCLDTPKAVWERPGGVRGHLGGCWRWLRAPRSAGHSRARAHAHDSDSHVPSVTSWG